MGSVSYFEIGGKIVECHSTSPSSSSPSPSLFRGAPTIMSEGATPRNKQVAGGRKGDHTRIEQISTVPGRARRARTAFTLAGALIMVDGPLPFGDAAAAAVLIGYGTYETVKSVQILFG